MSPRLQLLLILRRLIIRLLLHFICLHFFRFIRKIIGCIGLCGLFTLRIGHVALYVVQEDI